MSKLDAAGERKCAGCGLVLYAEEEGIYHTRRADGSYICHTCLSPHDDAKVAARKAMQALKELHDYGKMGAQLAHRPKKASERVTALTNIIAPLLEAYL